jgi:hypothetical protein
MQTSSEARELLASYTFGEVQEILDNRNEESTYTNSWAVYLGFLCAKGRLQDVEDYLQNVNGDLALILNSRSSVMYGGTVLHKVLYWNSGNTGLELFQLLVNNGALFYRDDNGHYPWQQNGTRWCTGLHMDDNDSTLRNVDEFTELYQFIGEMYNMV